MLSFHFVYGSFAVQKLLSLIRSHLFIFVFISITLGDRSKKILLQLISESVLHMLSSKSFIVSGLILRSLIHFEHIFVYGVRECSNFIFFTCSCPVFQAPLIEETVFPPLYSLASFVVDLLTIGEWVYFWAFYPVPLIYIPIFVTVPYCFDGYSFVV